MTEKKYWLSPYDECDICHSPIKNRVPWFVDGKTTYGCWALMCPLCFSKHGIKIQFGYGQKYDGITAELLEGGSKLPESEEDLGLSCSDITEALKALKNEL